MKDLLRKKQEAFDKHCYHMALVQKHEREARKWRLIQFDINEEIREMERELAEPLKVVYGS